MLLYTMYWHKPVFVDTLQNLLLHVIMRYLLVVFVKFYTKVPS